MKLSTTKLIAITATAGLAIISVTGYAATSEASQSVQPNQAQLQQQNNVRPVIKREYIRFNRFSHRNNESWHFGFHRNKHFNKVDARIITKAALLMQDKKSVKVGEIKEVTHKSNFNVYKIDLLNKHDKLIKQVIFNGADGHIHPAGRYNRA